MENHEQFEKVLIVTPKIYQSATMSAVKLRFCSILSYSEQFVSVKHYLNACSMHKRLFKSTPEVLRMKSYGKYKQVAEIIHWVNDKICLKMDDIFLILSASQCKTCYLT